MFLPEFTSCDVPYLGLPFLTAYLRTYGHEVSQRDLNVEFLEYFLSTDGIDYYQPRAAAALQRLNRLPRLSPLEQRAYSRLVWGAVTPRDTLIREVTRIPETLRSQAYYDIGEYGGAMRTLNAWGHVLEGMSLVPGDGLPPDVYRFYDSSAVIEQVIANPDTNPYTGFLSGVVDGILAEQPDLVGMSLVVPTQILPVLTMGWLLKSREPELPIVLGGNICTRLADVLPGRPGLFRYFDAAVIKEGEGPLLALVEAVASGTGWSRVPNLIYADSEAVRVTPLAEPVNINELPAPDFDGLPLDRYLAPARSLPLYSCRGCYWGKCAFCNIHVGYARFRPRKPELVISDMIELKQRYGAEIINLVDEATPLASLSAIADGLTAEGLDVDWTTHARFERGLTPELARRLRKSGCTALYFGLEAGSGRVLDLMDRGIDLDVASRVLETVHNAGLVTHMNIIIGFPGETEAEASESVNFALNHAAVLDSLYVTPFVMGRWTPVAADPTRWGVTIEPSEANDLAMFHQDFNYDGEGWLSPERAEEFRWNIERDLSGAYPAFGLRQYGEALPFYIRHYATTDREQILRLSRGDRQPPARTRVVDTIELAPDTLLLEFPHDFPAIRRLLAHPQSRHGPLAAAPSAVLYDVVANRLFRLSATQLAMTRAMVGREWADAAVCAAGALGVDRERAEAMMRAFSAVARGLIDFPPGGVNA